MALLQAVNSEGGMATGDDLMEFSTEGRSPMVQDEIDIDIPEGGVSLQDQDMGDGDGGHELIDDDEMADGEQPTATVPAGAGDDLDLNDAEHPEPVGGGDAPTVDELPTAPENPATEEHDTMAQAGDDVGGDDEDEEPGENENVAAPDVASESDDDSPPPRRPAGKGPAMGRAPQKTPAVSAAAAENEPETTSQNSGEDSQDEDNAPHDANPTTTEPSFTESAKNESESEDESEGEQAAPPANKPAYQESLSDSDSESLVDHGPVHSIIVDYQGSKISLFPPQPDHEEQESYLLQDEGLCHEPITRMLGECRHVLHETLLEDEELVLTIPCLGVSISEQIADTMSTTMTELVNLFLQLSYNDGVGAPAALRVTLDTKEKCNARIDLIRRMIGDGKGLSHVLAHLHGGGAAPAPAATAAHKQPAPRDFGDGGEDDLSQAGDPADPSAATDAFVPSEPQDFEEQFDVQTPGGEPAYRLTGTGAENDPDFLDFTSPEKQGKGAGAPKDPASNFDDVFDGDFGSADNLLPAGGAGGVNLPAAQAGLDDFGAELGIGGGDFVDTLDAANNSKAGAGASGAEAGVAPSQPTENDDVGSDWIQNPEDDFAAPTEDQAQAAEDEFTFIDTAADGDETVDVGDPEDGGVSLIDDVGSGSPAALKRARPDDEDEVAGLGDVDAQAKRVRAE